MDGRGGKEERARGVEAGGREEKRSVPATDESAQIAPAGHGELGEWGQQSV